MHGRAAARTRDSIDAHAILQQHVDHRCRYLFGAQQRRQMNRRGHQLAHGNDPVHIALCLDNQPLCQVGVALVARLVQRVRGQLAAARRRRRQRWRRRARGCRRQAKEQPHGRVRLHHGVAHRDLQERAELRAHLRLVLAPEGEPGRRRRQRQAPDGGMPRGE